jgi:predicted ribosomally synthesized peptide with nif11-like leader
MSEQGVQALLERARTDADFRATLEGAHTRDDRRKIVKDAGFDVDASDASSLRSMVPPHELSDNDLERIAGGAGGAVTSGGGEGFIAGMALAAAAAV